MKIISIAVTLVWRNILQTRSQKCIELQQDIIDREMAEMLPDEVNDILRTMKKEEANEFLGRLGQIRTAITYGG